MARLLRCVCLGVLANVAVARPPPPKCTPFLSSAGNASTSAGTTEKSHAIYVFGRGEPRSEDERHLEFAFQEYYGKHFDRLTEYVDAEWIWSPQSSDAAAWTALEEGIDEIRQHLLHCRSVLLVDPTQAFLGDAGPGIRQVRSDPGGAKRCDVHAPAQATPFTYLLLHPTREANRLVHAWRTKIDMRARRLRRRVELVGDFPVPEVALAVLQAVLRDQRRSERPLHLCNLECAQLALVTGSPGVGTGELLASLKKAAARRERRLVPAEGLCFQHPTPDSLLDENEILPGPELRTSVPNPYWSTMMRLVAASQERDDCTPKTVVDLNFWFFESGFGSKIMSTFKTFLYALRSDLAFVSTRMFPLYSPLEDLRKSPCPNFCGATPEECPARHETPATRALAMPLHDAPQEDESMQPFYPTFSCFFEPASRCETSGSWVYDQDIGRKETTVLPVNKAMSYARHGRALFPAFRAQGNFFWVAAMATWLCRPNARLQRALDKTVKQLGLDRPENRPTLAMHVRHGDSCLEEEQVRMARSCSPLSTYVEKARAMIKTYGYRSVFLLTDDPNVVAETAQYPDIPWLVSKASSGDPLMEFYPGRIWDDALRIDREKWERGDKPLMPVHEHTMGLLVDVLLMGHSDGLVGKFTSNIDRLGYALMYGLSGGCHKPVVSLEGRWCFDFGEKVGFGADGQRFMC